MIDVSNRVQVYGDGDEKPAIKDIEVRNHAINNTMVVIVIDGQKVKVSSRDLIAAINNSTNVARY